MNGTDWLDQPGLFDDDSEDICRNYHGGESFSELANESIEPSKEILRGRIITHLTRVGNATCDECERALDMCHQTASARLSELKRDGLIEAVLDQYGNRVSRATRHGRPAGVYRITTRMNHDLPHV